MEPVKKSQARKEYGEEYTELMVESFWKWRLQLSGAGTHEEERQPQM